MKSDTEDEATHELLYKTYQGLNMHEDGYTCMACAAGVDYSRDALESFFLFNQ